MTCPAESHFIQSGAANPGPPTLNPTLFIPHKEVKREGRGWWLYTVVFFTEVKRCVWGLGKSALPQISGWKGSKNMEWNLE